MKKSENSNNFFNIYYYYRAARCSPYGINSYEKNNYKFLTKFFKKVLFLIKK